MLLWLAKGSYVPLWWAAANLHPTLDDEKTARKATELTLCYIAAHISDWETGNFQSFQLWWKLHLIQGGKQHPVLQHLLSGSSYSNEDCLAAYSGFMPNRITFLFKIFGWLNQGHLVIAWILNFQVNTVVSGALDRLHYEKDPCVKYDIGRKLWIYLHRDRSEEEFGKPGLLIS